MVVWGGVHGTAVRSEMGAFRKTLELEAKFGRFACPGSGGGGSSREYFISVACGRPAWQIRGCGLLLSNMFSPLVDSWSSKFHHP